MAATYDISTLVGKSRLHATDTDIAEAIYTDEEWEYFLELTGSNPLLAAAMGLDAMATDAAKIAVINKDEKVSTDPTKVPELLGKRAETLRAQAAASYAGDLTVVADRVRVFQPEESSTVPGNLDPW